MSFAQLGPDTDKLGSYLYPPARADEEKPTYSTCSAVLKEVPIVASATCCRGIPTNFVSHNNNLLK
ncbi:hypothetical protein BH18THE1_BH18THE1_05710 [soil metagenome]